MNMRHFSIIACVFFILFFASYSYPELYKWVDKNGQVHITDYPDPDKPIPSTDESVRQPVSPSFQESSPESAPVSPPPSENDSPSQEPPKEITPPPAISTPQPQMPSVTPAIPKPPPVKVEAPEPPIEILYIFIIFLVILVIYLYVSLCLFLIAKKLGVPSPIFAWIPLIQVWTFVVSAKGTGGHPCLWILSMVIPIIGPLIGIYLWMCITENLGRNKWLALLMLLPPVGFLFMGWLAFSKGEMVEEKGQALA